MKFFSQLQLWAKTCGRPALCAASLVLALHLPLLGEEPAPPLPIAPEKQGEMKEIRLTEIQDGEKKWVLTAESADYLRDKDRIFLRRVWVEVFGLGPENVTISGEAGYIGVKTRDLTLEGEVHVKTADYEFTSDLVHYNPQTRVISAPGPVKIQNPRLYVEGKGMTVDLKNNKVDLAQHTVTKLHVSGKLWTR